MAENFLLITNLLIFCSFFYGIYAFFKWRRQDDENEKAKWGKRAKIAGIVFAISLVGQMLEPESSKAERTARLEQQEKDRQIRKEREAKEEKIKAEKEAERKAQEAQQAEEKRKAEEERKARKEAEKKAAAEQKAKDDMMRELTTGWNTENTNADEDHTNFQKAADLIYKYPDYLRQAEAISPAPQSMLKKPWDYYGKVVELTGRIYGVEQLPPGASMVKFFHKDCFHAMFVPAGDDVTFVLYIVGAPDNLQDNMTVTVRGFAYGHEGLVNTKFGGKSKGVGMMGVVVE